MIEHKHFKIIGVDTGNKSIKTANFCFTSGIVKHDANTFESGETLTFQNNKYGLSEKRIKYTQDKTTSDNFYLLTVIAMAKELILGYKTNLDANSLNYNDNNVIRDNVYLCVGLPITHMRFNNEFKRYFLRNKNLKFKFNNFNFDLILNDVFVFPQSFSASSINKNQLEIAKSTQSYMIDIGGYITDILRMVNGNPDLSFYQSYDIGMIKLLNKIKNTIANTYGIKFDDINLETFFEAKRNNSTMPSIFDNNIISLIDDICYDYCENLFKILTEDDVELIVNRPIFIGGGSISLTPYLKAFENKYFKNAFFTSNIHENAVGYEKIGYNILYKKGIISNK